MQFLKQKENDLNQKQRSKRIGVIGMEEKKDKNLNKTISKLFNDQLKIQSSDIQIEECYRIFAANSRPSKGVTSSSPILVTFATVSGRDLLLRNRSKLHYDCRGLNKHES
ncbi:hypothetical protein HHI36_017206 [Cryptolaemus montrouzieri]|uniref:Uncharacterized protein n=1 Tax=Cryptolaemus montrouzieri TaxID=559131 RepID=A0ABD2NM69_9CUCU